MDVTAHLLYFVYNWFTVKLYCCYRWVFLYHNPFYAYHIIAYCNMLYIIVSSQTNYTVVIDTFLYHSLLHCYHIVMFTVFLLHCLLQYISFMSQY